MFTTVGRKRLLNVSPPVTGQANGRQCIDSHDGHRLTASSILELESRKFHLAPSRTALAKCTANAPPRLCPVTQIFRGATFFLSAISDKHSMMMGNIVWMLAA